MWDGSVKWYVKSRRWNKTLSNHHINKQIIFLHHQLTTLQNHQTKFNHSTHHQSQITNIFPTSKSYCANLNKTDRRITYTRSNNSKMNSSITIMMIIKNKSNSNSISMSNKNNYSNTTTKSLTSIVMMLDKNRWSNSDKAMCRRRKCWMRNDRWAMLRLNSMKKNMPHHQWKYRITSSPITWNLLLPINITKTVNPHISQLSWHVFSSSHITNTYYNNTAPQTIYSTSKQYSSNH